MAAHEQAMAAPEEQRGMAKMQLLIPIVTQLAGGKLAERKCAISYGVFHL